MSQWRAESTVTETLDDIDPPPARSRWVATVLASVGLGAAFALGVESRGVSLGGVSLGADRPTLAAGLLSSVPASGGGARFAVPVHNSGDEAVQVSVAAVPGATLRRTPRARVLPGRWTEVSFDARADCRAGAVAPATVTLDVAGAADRSVELGLVEPGRVLADLHDAQCAAARPLPPGRLAGVWLVERVYGRWTGLAGRHVLLFRRDGSFVADPEGVRFTSHRGVLGRYLLRGGRLVAVAQGFVGYACLPGERAVWRAEQLPRGRAVLTFLGGRNCPDQPGEAWVLRRMAGPGAGRPLTSARGSAG